MDLLPFGTLPPYKPRRFVPPNINLGNWSEVAPLFDQLETRGAHCHNTADFEDWLLAWGELSAALDEEASLRYIAMTCHTDNAEAEKAFLHFIEHIEPQIKPRQFALEQIYNAHPLHKQLPPHRFEVFDRDIKNRVALFCPENIVLETEEAKLCQQYQKLSGALTVHFRGEEKTLVQMGRYLEEPDRPLRQESWELVVKRRLEEAEKFEDIFDNLLQLRQQIAANAGFKNYRDYAFRKLGRFDYTWEDCVNFHKAIETEIMPILSELHNERRHELGLPKLRPWDLTVDPQSRPPLHPFDDIEQMVSRAQNIFNSIDIKLGASFRKMRELKLLDLDNRKGKAPGGYQCTLPAARLPFIFMNAVGLQRDVETLLHEAGHAFHALATQSEDLYAYRGAPIEFCEVASMAMELLGNEFLEEFYSRAEANRARCTHLEGIISFFPWMATVDAFQHWLYTHPGHTRSERKAAWLEILNRFSGDIDWSGYETAKAHLWHRQLHIFLHPFYYVEYGIAQLGALQVWANAKKDRSEALNAYISALALGNSRPLPELFSAAGCALAFDTAAIHPLIQLVKTERKK